MAHVALAAILATSPARAELTSFERRARLEQLDHLEGIAERHAPVDATGESVVGALIVRDASPHTSAACRRKLAGAAPRDVLAHELECPHCRSLIRVVRDGLEAPAIRGRPVTERSRRQYLEAVSLMQDRHGYVRTPAADPVRFEHGKTLLDSAVRDSPDFADALHLRAIVAELDGEPALAERAFKKALNLSGTAAWALNNLARFYQRNDLQVHATHVLRLSLERHGEYRTARLLARVHELPGGERLVTVSEAVRLMEWVVVRHGSDAPEKIVADLRYLEALRRSRARVIAPWRDAGDPTAGAGTERRR